TGDVSPRPAKVDDVRVMIFPFDYASWIDNGMSVRRYSIFSPNETGRYDFVQRLAGDYFVVALPAPVLDAWDGDPALIPAFARVATRVTLQEDDWKGLDLKLQSISGLPTPSGGRRSP